MKYIQFINITFIGIGMGFFFLPFLASAGIGALSSILGKKKGKQQNQTTAFQQQLQPSINYNKSIADFGATGQTQVNTATSNIDELLKYYKTILYGTSDEILKNVDLSSVTEGIDDAERNLYSIGVRGGMRASELGQMEFNKQAAINKILQLMRTAAPEHLAELSGLMAQIGQGKLQIGLSANDANARLFALIEEMRQSAKNRKGSLINSIIGAGASIAGATIASIRK